jgi:hypothetical protein|tara:strand:- start:208 stop:1710 length:1503 start_codon:yes stop_codon:yes gene_type:complete
MVLNMLKNSVMHPFLFSLFPILFIFQYNIHEVPLQDTLWPLFLSFIIALGLWVILRFFIGGKKSGLIVSLTIMLFVIYGNLHTFILNSDSQLTFLGGNMIMGTVFLILLIVGIIYFVKTKRILDNANSIANTIGLVMIGILVTSVAIYYYENPVDYSTTYFSDMPSTANNVPIKPDIYLLIFDEYAGNISLKNNFQYDNTDFLKKLESAGFYVPKISYANYPNTGLSIPSTLNMNYLDFLTEELGKDSADMRLPNEFRDNSLVMKVLKLYGYEIISFYGGLGAPGNTNLVSEKLCSYGTVNTDLRKNLVLTYLPITYFNTALLEVHQKEKLDCMFSILPEIKGTDDAPVFAIGHFRLPHEPFIYDSAENEVTGKSGDDKEAYLEQLIYSNKKILELVDKILENTTRDPVIIVISDHGYRSVIDWENPSTEDYIAGFNILAAYHIPNEIDNLPETISLTNIFRIIFNSYLDTEFEILEDRQMWYTQQRPFDFTDVTDELPR